MNGKLLKVVQSKKIGHRSQKQKFNMHLIEPILPNNMDSEWYGSVGSYLLLWLK